MINFQLPAPAYMLRQNGRTVFAQPAGGAIFTNPLVPQQRQGGWGASMGEASYTLTPQQNTYQAINYAEIGADPNCGVLNVLALPGESQEVAYRRAAAAWEAKHGRLVPAQTESEEQARCRMETAYKQAQQQAAQQQAAAQQMALHQQHGTVFAPPSAPSPALVDPRWQKDLYISPSFSSAQRMAQSGLAPQSSLAPQSFGAQQPFVVSPLSLTRDPQAEAAAAARDEIQRRAALPSPDEWEGVIDGLEFMDRQLEWMGEKERREAQQRHAAYLAQEAAAEEARRQLAATAPPVAQSNTLLWVGLGAAALGAAWWAMSNRTTEGAA